MPILRCVSRQAECSRSSDLARSGQQIWTSKVASSCIIASRNVEMLALGHLSPAVMHVQGSCQGSRAQLTIFPVVQVPCARLSPAPALPLRHIDSVLYRATCSCPARRHVKELRAEPEERDGPDVGSPSVGEELVPGEALDELVLEETELAAGLIPLNDETLSASVQAAEQLLTTYKDELFAEADMGDDDNSPPEAVAARADDALEAMLSAAANSNTELSAALTPPVENLVDVLAADEQGPEGFRRYDEEESAGISEQQRAEIAPFKLTKTELSGLVPQDWDSINIDWFVKKKEQNIPLPEYKLNFIWAEKVVGVAVDQVYSMGQISPLTEYFFWPRHDAWDELRMALEQRPWISERDRIILLNRTTEVINAWQQEGEARPSLEDAAAAFPDCSFLGPLGPVGHG